MLGRGAETSFRRGETLEDARLPGSIKDISLPPVPIRPYMREGLCLAFCNLHLTKLVCHGSEFYPPAHLTSLKVASPSPKKSWAATSDSVVVIRLAVGLGK